jgi:hypothetical protein
MTVLGFYSVSAVTQNRVAVRARSREHLENLRARFPRKLGKEPVHRLKNRDYPFRIYVDKHVWASIVGELVTEQTWSNFKGEVKKRKKTMVDAAYLGALHRVWWEMRQFESACVAKESIKKPLSPPKFTQAEADELERIFLCR